MLSQFVIKAIYFTLVVVLLLPSLVAAVITIRGAQISHCVQQEEQQRTSDTVYVTSHVHFGLGPFQVTLHPHAWAAFTLLFADALLFVAMLFPFFVRQ